VGVDHHLKKFSEREGHCRVPALYKTSDGYGLGSWVRKNRNARNKIDPDRRQRLEELPGWSWAVHSDAWEEGFSHLERYSEREGHCRVDQRYKTEDNYQLGTWVSWQRGHAIDPDRRQRLETLAGWSWDPLSKQWEEGFYHLKQFSEQYGHCRIPHGFKTEDGYRLGQWVGVQRSRTNDKMRRQRLEALPGWVWKVEKPLPQAAAAQVEKSLPQAARGSGKE
jgi:hypothetical protein